MIILGIDPGVAATGYGIIKKHKDRFTLVDFGVISTPPKIDLSSRLNLLNNELSMLIKKHKPDLVAIEKIFFCKNIKTALDVGHARGIAMLRAAQRGVPIQEYTPLEVKCATTGYGRATKAQIQKMIKALLGTREIPKPDDAADALAIAYCAAVNLKNIKT